MLLILDKSQNLAELALFLTPVSQKLAVLFTQYVRLSGATTGITLNQLGSGKSVNYRGRSIFHLAFTRCKLTSPGIWQMCNRALQFRESTQIGAAILLYLERARNWPDFEPASPCTLHSPGREIYKNVD
jgi:hypothetical protein